MPRDLNAQQTLRTLADALDISVLEAEQVIRYRAYPDGSTPQQLATEIRRLINLDAANRESDDLPETPHHDSDVQYILFTLHSSHDNDWTGPTDNDVQQIMTILGPGPYVGQEADDQETVSRICDAAEQVMKERY